jgi:ubiquinone/menaquinone biosynthesis C-methylase UbiE
VEARKKAQITLHERLSGEYEIRYGYGFSMLFQSFRNEKLISFLPDASQSVVLDCGCGVGVLLADLVSRYASVYGIDISWHMLKQAQSGDFNKSELIVGDAEYIPFEDDFFDAVICRGSLHHVPSVARALAELRRILKEGGVLVLSEPCNDFLLVRLARKVMYSISDRFEEEDAAFLSDELESLVKGAGFTITEREKFGYFAYVLAGFPDLLPLLKYVPCNLLITRFLIVLDRILCRIPVLRDLGLHVILAGRL